MPRAILLLSFFLCSSFSIARLQATQYYNDWAASYFGSNPAQASPTNDPDGDGDANLMEFAFGTDPTVAGANADKISPRFGAANGSNGVFSVDIFERPVISPACRLICGSLPA